MRRILTTTRFWALLAVVGCALVGFSAMFTRLRGLFSDPLEDMSHGWLVPVFSLYVLWSERRRLREAVDAPSAWGLVACVPCVLLALLGTRGLQLRFEQLGFAGLCIAVPWAFWGKRVARLCVFPALFLLFTVPVATYLDTVTIHLRLLASGTAFAVLRGLGVDVVQQGTAIVSQAGRSFSIDVAEPCSGLRSLVALMALTAAYAWATQPTWKRRGALFLCSIPLAVLGNVMRILTICLVAAWASPQFALGFYHDYSGYIVFVVAIALMVVCGEIVTRVAERWGRTRAEDGPSQSDSVPGRTNGDGSPRSASSPGWTRVVVPVLAALVLCPLFVCQSLTPQTTLMEAPEITLPESLPDGYRGEGVRYCQNEQCGRMFMESRLEKGREGTCPHCGHEMRDCSLAELTVLPADTRILKRVYQAPSGDRFLVSVVIGGATKSSLHRPELCMPAQGFLMRDPQDFEVAGRPFHAIRLESPRGPSTVLSYTFLNQAGMRTSSHLRRILRDVWDRSVLNRIDRWVMVTVSASGFDGFTLSRGADRRSLESFLARLSEVLP